MIEWDKCNGKWDVERCGVPRSLPQKVLRVLTAMPRSFSTLQSLAPLMHQDRRHVTTLVAVAYHFFQIAIRLKSHITPLSAAAD